MSRRKDIKLPEHFCEECQFCQWVKKDWNRSPDGRPIIFRCPHIKNGTVGEVRGRVACREHFRPL